MTKDNTYNGWANRETWLVNLWLTNEPNTEKTLIEIAESNSELYEKSDQLKDFVYTLCMGENSEINGTASSLVCDLVTNSLDSVDYREIILGNIE
jgi:hypothetical protein|tara:strand:- start:317 stop:601 length:285 start_codon:yes stop_codon:yes gene_type:complete